jgi:hypothetical protein
MMLSALAALCGHVDTITLSRPVFWKKNSMRQEFVPKISNLTMRPLLKTRFYVFPGHAEPGEWFILPVNPQVGPESLWLSLKHNLKVYFKCIRFKAPD